MKKRIIITFLSILLITTSCTNNKNTIKEETNKLTIFTTLFPPYDFIREIADDKVEVTMLIPLGSETHHYEPTPKQMIEISKCDIFIYTGGESDSWIDDLLNSIDTTDITIIKLMDVVALHEEEIIEGMEEDHEDDEDSDVEYDEHVWTSIKNSIKIVEYLNLELIKLDPENKDLYQNNTNLYTNELSTLDHQFSELVNSSSFNTLIFADRFPFRYFIEDYHLEYFAAFPGCSDESEASASTIAFLIDKVNEEKIPVVFYIEFSTEKLADTIIESTNAKKLLFHSAHNISNEDYENGVTYLSIMQENYRNLEEALK